MTGTTIPQQGVLTKPPIYHTSSSRRAVSERAHSSAREQAGGTLCFSAPQARNYWAHPGAPSTRAPGWRRFCAIWDGSARGFRVMGWRLKASACEAEKGG